MRGGRRADAVPDLEEFFARWSTLHGGYDPRGTRWVEPWLRITYRLARPLARARVAPDAVTLAGLPVSAAVVALAGRGGRWPLVAALVTLATAVLDGLDGAVAVLRDRATRWGFVLDSAVDRVSDLLFLTALLVLGAPAAMCAGGAALALLLEYVRARAAAAGMAEIGVVTVWERATRVVVTVMFLLAAGVYAGQAQLWATLGAAAWLGLGTVGLGQLLVVVRRRLRVLP